jgi:nickel-dependent lactate racemase
MSMKKVKIPWRAWYGDKDHKLTLPDEWDVQVLGHKGGRELRLKDVEAAIDAPIGTARLSDLADGRGTATIAVDDLSRPTPGARLLPAIIERLTGAGIRCRDIRIVMAVGAHRPCTRHDLLKKLGDDVLDCVSVENHHPYENLVDLGESSRGTPILVNGPFMEGDLKLAVGCVIPHYGPGFGGGGKIVLPGLAGMETIRANHIGTVRGLVGGVGLTEGNDQLSDIREVVKRIGLDFIVNVVTSGKRQIVGVFAGDFVEAHDAAIEFGRGVYSTEVPTGLDVAVCNAYPKDTDFMQAVNAFNVFITGPSDLLREDGTVVLTSAATEGWGYHSLQGKGMPLEVVLDVGKTFGGRDLLVFSPNTSESDINTGYRGAVRAFRRWSALVKALKGKHGQRCQVGVFPNGPLQVAEGYDANSNVAKPAFI